MHFFCFCLTSCQPTQRGPHELIVGVIAGPEAALVEEAQKIAREKGLTVRIVSFEDYAMPNRALAEGSIDINAFQHAPYLANTNTQQGYHLVSIAKTFLYPMGLYSNKYKSLNDLRPGSRIGIPNDPSNQARALNLLAEHHLITLAPSNAASLAYITDNPKNYRFLELDAAQLPRTLHDLDLAAINTNYALPAGLDPSLALALESKDVPYANLLVTRAEDQPLPKYQIFIEAMHDPRVLRLAETLFHGYAVSAW